MFGMTAKAIAVVALVGSSLGASAQLLSVQNTNVPKVVFDKSAPIVIRSLKQPIQLPPFTNKNIMVSVGLVNGLDNSLPWQKPRPNVDLIDQRFQPPVIEK